MPHPDIIDLDVPGARARLFLDAPSWGGLRTAAVGAFSCRTAAAGATLLDEARRLLVKEQFEAVVGPMDGDIWHSHRLVTENDGSAPFFLEPVSGPHDFEAFERAGFCAIETYVSARATLREAIGETLPQVAGLRTVPWDGRDAERLIGELHAVSSRGFSGNRFFTPLGKEAFRMLYAPVLPLLDPRLVFFALDEQDEVAGLLFGLPDRREGPRPSSVIIKTYASRRPGAGHLLVDSFLRAAAALGYEKVIYALMHVDNISDERALRHAGCVFRRYALMGAKL